MSSIDKYYGLMLLFPGREHLQGLLRLQRAVRSPEGRQDEPSAVFEHSGTVDYFIQNDSLFAGLLRERRKSFHLYSQRLYS